MRAVVALLSPRSFARASVLLTIGFAVANCSSDATRFNENPFANRAGPGDPTGSAPRAQAAPVGQVETRPLGEPHASALPPPPASRPGTLGGGVSGGGRGLGSFQPSADMSGDLTGSTPRLRAEPKHAAKPSWTWEGGTPVTIGAGDTLATLSQRYGVPADAIAEANGLRGPAALRPGQRVVIPRYSASGVAARAGATPVAASAAHAPMLSIHIVAPGETLVGIAKRYGRPITELAAANKIAPHTMVKMGDRLIIPGKSGALGRTAALTPDLQPALSPVAVPPAPPPVTQPRVADKPVAAQTKLASAEPTASIRLATPAADAVADEDRASRGAAPAFRWPVRGRVIAGFGAANNGQQNDGINLAVPEGTAVRAAEDGVVAYAGSELKGYGNLILVRHSNGFVTAYAHASEIMVKRNDPVRRGQVIAKSGQTGTVTSPQLHFEIRKGSAPVDPMQHLASGG
jgi:murein DD-endopeptidase MepM/ murein hydrolase activator NlpD